ncbi:MAG: HIT domain-containing protein [Armatimonadota bacterium]|nr:HIT domain-containing protein [Armatimonadota bacterium]
MKQLWAPWRLEYIVSEKEEGCIFCRFPAENDDERRLILYRGRLAFVIMNAYPYSNGHLLIAPYRHIPSITELSDEESLEIMQLTKKSCTVLSEVCRPDGFNIGINIGTAAGAGIADHVHLHIVPRWNGDTNFMPVFADVKVIPEALQATYAKLKPRF